MNHLFDHAMISVRDLDEAVAHYRALGFDVQSGGEHPGVGTHNALISFGQDYVELLSVRDKSEAERNVVTGELVDFLAKHEAGLTMYGLSTTAIQYEAERFHQSRLAALGPFSLSREQSDGHVRTWSLLIPIWNNTHWCQPFPFFIQLGMPGERLLSQNKPVSHPNGAAGCKGIAVAVRDLDRVADLYEHLFDLELVRLDKVPALASVRATFRAGAFEIDLLSPYDRGPVQHMLDTDGEKPFELRLAVKGLEQTRAFFAQHSLNSEPGPIEPDSIMLSPQQTLGVRLVFSSC
jgi:catechol 2,3-dioxygenase-like lactoylglutathione lyase family enzyme